MSVDLTALNKQAIQAAKKHMAQVAWPTVVFAALVLIGYVASLTLFALGYLPAWVATLLLAALTYMSYTPLHEAVHGNVSGGRNDLNWLNDVCGYLMAPMIVVPYASHKLEHFTHHRYTNQPDKDPDYVVGAMGKGPITAFFTLFRFFWVQNNFFVQHHWGRASSREKMIYVAEVTFSLGWRAVFVATVSQPGALFVILLSYIMGGFFTAYWFAYRPHAPYRESTRYRNTSSLIMPRWMKPVEWFWLGQNLHSIHHLFPRVPFYRYHALHREIEPIMRAHGTPMIGTFSRKPVP